MPPTPYPGPQSSSDSSSSHTPLPALPNLPPKYLIASGPINSTALLHQPPPHTPRSPSAACPPHCCQMTFETHRSSHATLVLRDGPTEQNINSSPNFCHFHPASNFIVSNNRLIKVSQKPDSLSGAALLSLPGMSPHLSYPCPQGTFQSFF